MRNLKDGHGYELRRRAAPSLAVVAAAGGAAPAPAAELVLYDIIGEDLFGGISSRKVMEDLKALGSAPVDVRLNSPGGDVFEGLAIYNALVRYPGQVTVHVDALAASVASVVAMGGDRIVMAPSALLMVHHAQSWAAGDAAELQRMAAVLEKADASLFSTYAARSGRRAETILARVDAAGREWWLSASEAVKEGLADEVGKAPEEKMAALLDAGFRLVPHQLVDGAAPVWLRPTGAAAAPLEALEVLAPRTKKGPAAGPDPGRPPQVPQPGAPGPEAAAASQRRRIVEVVRAGS